MVERDEFFNQALNESVREALGRGRPKSHKPFEQITFDMGKPLIDLTKALSRAGELEDAEVIARSRRLLVAAGTAGNLTTDAHLAALAIEHGGTVGSFDHDFERFPGVNLELLKA